MGATTQECFTLAMDMSMENDSFELLKVLWTLITRRLLRRQGRSAVDLISTDHAFLICADKLTQQNHLTRDPTRVDRVQTTSSIINHWLLILNNI